MTFDHLPWPLSLLYTDYGYKPISKYAVFLLGAHSVCLDEIRLPYLFFRDPHRRTAGSIQECKHFAAAECIGNVLNILAHLQCSCYYQIV